MVTSVGASRDDPESMLAYRNSDAPLVEKLGAKNLHRTRTSCTESEALGSESASVLRVTWAFAGTLGRPTYDLFTLSGAGPLSPA